MTQSRTRMIQLLGLGAACLASFAQLLQMINRHAVNILFWDQWDFLTGLREHLGQWQLFSWLHGPGRMGLGYLFIETIYAAGGWDTRIEAFAIAGLYLVTLALALILKNKAVGSFTLLDICIPALLLSRTQFEIFVGTPNAGHGPIPLLLVMVSPFLWLIRTAPLRVALAALLSFAAAFTGFGILLIPGMIALFVLDAVRPTEERTSRIWPAVGALLCLASLFAFFVDYRFASASGCYAFPYSRPLQYLPFAGLVFGRAMRIGHLFPGAVLIGVVVALVALVFTAWTVLRVVDRNRTLLSRTTFLFSSFSLAFAFNAAIGRVCLGMDAALTSRYVAYVLPFWLALYFAVASKVERQAWLKVAAGFGAAFLFGLQASISNDSGSMRWFSDGKSRWRDCYLATADEARCNATTQFRVYPVEGAPQVARMLEYLRQNHLNLYKPDQGTSTTLPKF